MNANAQVNLCKVPIRCALQISRISLKFATKFKTILHAHLENQGPIKSRKKPQCWKNKWMHVCLMEEMLDPIDLSPQSLHTVHAMILLAETGRMGCFSPHFSIP